MFNLFKRKIRAEREALEVFEGYITFDEIETLKRKISDKADLDILTLWLKMPVSKSHKVELRIIERGESE